MEDIQITSKIKQKNPKRVAQGKKLAAMSKEAKERKTRERLLAEKELSQQDDSSGSSKYIVVGLILAGAGTYYVYVKYNKVPKNKQPEQKQPLKKSEQSDQGVKLINLFD